MMLFPPREAMTTAEQPEPLHFSAYGIHYMQTNSSEDGRPGGEAIRVQSCSFVVHIQLLVT